MKQTRAVCLLSACAFLAGACALEPVPDEAAGPKAERVYVTGSNIAKRQVGNVTVLDREEAQREMSLHSMPMPMPGGAH